MTTTTDPTGTDPVRTINTGEREGFSTSRHLEHAKRQAEERSYKDILIVDVDAHHYEEESWPEIVEYIEDPVIRHRAKLGVAKNNLGSSLLFRPPANQSISGRLQRKGAHKFEEGEEGTHREITMVRREMEAIGIDYQVVFPTPMLQLGMHPDPQVEVAVSWAYSRWFTEQILPHDPKIKTMIYLPFNEPDQCVRFVEQFADKPGVVGFMVTAARYRPAHHNAYMKVYRALEERDMPIGFHAIFHEQERMFEGMNKFLSVHALGFIFYNLVHITNIVINGIPERFPKLKFMWIEGGLAWVPFLMQRLDNEYMMRTSEAPLLKKLPSDYMRDMFYTSQPIENRDVLALENGMRMMNAETQLMFASDYPHWDFNLPSTIYDLPFLSDQAKRQILGENARRVFNLDK
jgi:predicted TIM-barrel fold metal-dependent hydrolase